MGTAWTRSWRTRRPRTSPPRERSRRSRPGHLRNEAAMIQRMRHPRSAGGFTLIEILVAIALMVILMSAVTVIFMNTTETVAGAEARTDVYNNARYALD